MRLALPEFYKTDLELHDVILAIADDFSLSQEFWDRIFSLSDSVYYVRQMMNDPKEITTMNETFTTQINQSLESMFAGMQERMSVEDMQRVHGIVI